MSRTFRKNSRWFSHVNGEIFNDFRHSKFKDAKLKNLPDYEEIYGNYGYGYGFASVFIEATVPDADCYRRLHYNKDDKRMVHQIDRRRAQAALRKLLNDPEDFNSGVEILWNPSFDAWDYD